MSLTPLISATEIRQARKAMLATLRRGCRRYNRWLGWQGGSGEYDLEWNDREGFWVCAEAFPDSDHWVIFYGLDDPSDRRMLSIVCEINPPREGINRRCGGLFARDANGAVYLTHTGKIGGGRAGIGKSAFRRHYRGSWETVSWPDVQPTDVIVIGRLDSNRLPAHVAHFVSEVRRFKESAASLSPRTLHKASESEFNREFSGHRRGYHLRSKIETQCDHGIIVNALASALQAKSLEVANDQNRDLYVSVRNGQMRALFEVKTDVTTSTIYQAIGQLLYHSASQTPPPSLVMVLPVTPDTETKRVLDRLQIRVLVYGWKHQQPTFLNLMKALG